MINYDDAAGYIENIVRFTEKHPAGHTRSLLELLGNPDRNFKTVHVAGTNGKGSTCAFLSSVFTTQGIRCGSFTSPHIITMRDRFRINGVIADEAMFLSAYKKVLKAVEIMCGRGEPHPTYFEFLFLMACVMFSDAGVQIAVMETGLGGRLDATNTIEKPVVSVITSISRDHMAYLGDSIAKIAGEKAGIIKRGVPVVFDDSDEEASKVIYEIAEKNGSKAYPLSASSLRIIKRDVSGIIAGYSTEAFGKQEIRIPFNAAYQVENAGLAILTLSEIAETFGISKENVAAGIAKTGWTGRMQCLGEKIYVDGAHNEDGIRRFASNSAEIAGNEKRVIVFAVMADKEYDKMIEEIVQLLKPDLVITTMVSTGRAKNASELAELFKKYGAENTVVINEPFEAVGTALENQDGGYLFFAGSLYFVGEVLKYFGESQ